MEFTLMLTRGDMTILDPIEVIDLAVDRGIRHIGCKDVGATPEVLRKIAERIRSAGGVSYLELVSTSDTECLAAARTAAETGFRRLLGGTNAEKILSSIQGTALEFYPFVGTPVGHPTALKGSPEEIARDCRTVERLGCAGADLLAYRALDADPLDLVRAARSSLKGLLICAGSVDSPAKIRALADAGCDAFTIGSAVFNGSFAPRRGATASQLEEILKCL